MHNYWLIFFTFGDRKGCKFIKHALHERNPTTVAWLFYCLELVVIFPIPIGVNDEAEV